MKDLALAHAFEAMELNGHDASGYTALHMAAWLGDAEWVRDLLKSGADPNVRDTGRSGLTPFVLAFRLARPDVIAAFLEDWRCDWNKPDAAGLTAVHHAAAAGLLEFKRNNRSHFTTLGGAERQWICK